MENENVKIIDNQKGYLALPFDEKQFEAFIKGLLGVPQTITRVIKGNFEIHLKDLQNFHDLINQRIVQQNKGSLIQLKSKIYFSDDSSVLLSSYEELITYNEVKPIISEAVRMTWVYLIQFADKNVPEKQEIEIMIVSTPHREMIDDGIPVIFPNQGQFGIRIEHTARTWGNDIESLITNQIRSILKPCSKVKDFIRRKSITIGILSGVFFLLFSLVGVYIHMKEFVVNEIEKVSYFTQNSIDIIKKTDYLLNYIAENSPNIFLLKSLLFIVIAIFLSILIGGWVESLADNKIKSYVILTREAKNSRDKLLKKENRKTILFWISILTSIICGVLGNYIFYKLF